MKDIVEYLEKEKSGQHPNTLSYTQSWLCEINPAWWDYKDGKDPVRFSWTIGLDHTRFTAYFSPKITFASIEEAKKDA